MYSEQQLSHCICYIYISLNMLNVYVLHILHNIGYSYILKLLLSLYLHFSNMFKIHLKISVILRFQFNKFDRVTHFIECKTDICLYTLMIKLSNLTLYNLVNI